MKQGSLFSRVDDALIIDKPRLDVSFNKCLIRFKKSDSCGLFGRMYVDILAGLDGWFSNRSKISWKGKDMMRFRFLFILQVSSFKEKVETYDLSILPTDSSKQVIMKKYMNSLLPTPTTTDYKGAYTRNSLVSKSGIDRSSLLRNIGHQIDEKYFSGKDGQINPLFVSEMMGFPNDWLSLPFLKG